jgi:hypothetical protein
MTSVTLLMPQGEITARVDNAQALAGYIEAVNTAVAKVVEDRRDKTPMAGGIFIAIRTGGKSRAWVQFGPGANRDLDAAIITSVQSVSPCTVKDGDVIFALLVSLWGAPPTNGTGPVPLAWTEVIQKSDRSVDVEDVVKALWPQ